MVVLLLAVSARYGFHRDELYFIVAGRNPDWGYVDQPPFVPLLARLAELIAGTGSPVPLRVLPALAVGAVALLAASMALRFGGGRWAAVYAAFGVGWVGVLLGEGHLLSTAVFDFALWTLALWMLVRLLDGASPRGWLALGATIGVGLQNKHTIGFLAVAALAGVLLGGRRGLLRGPWPWLGASVATVLALPNLLWQATNGWPQLEMARAIADRGDGPLAFVALQPALLSIVLVAPAAAGWWWLLRSGEARRWRPLAVAFALLFVTFLAVGGKAYYLAPMYSCLIAAGATRVERLGRAPRRLTAGATALGLAFGLFVALPLLPVRSMSALDATGELAETVGWPDLIAQVGGVLDQIPAADRADAVVFTGSYGEAGAVDVLGPGGDLPPAFSGHNSYWSWGPPERHGPVIGVGAVGDVLAAICPSLQRWGKIANADGVENEEAGLPLYLCLAPSRQLADIWVDVRHFN
ncbi:MAG: glycosyltransferase family 39 protein [Thermoleophilia bacterium]|nr:glycosyltransferase family 39 protein [Thermoleophilia bacterium]